MPGPVSDSYDPEFGTGENADDVATAVRGVVESITKHLGPNRRNIVQVVHEAEGRVFYLPWTERELRVIRFGLERALESL